MSTSRGRRRKEGFLRDRSALSAVIATIIITAITLAMVMASSYWANGLASSFTRVEKLEVNAIYVVSVDGSYVVTVKYINTGAKEATVDAVLLNGVPYSSFVPSAMIGGDLGQLPSTCETGVGKVATITIRQGTSDPTGNALGSGVTLTVMLETSSGNDYPASVMLP